MPVMEAKKPVKNVLENLYKLIHTASVNILQETSK